MEVDWIYGPGALASLLTRLNFQPEVIAFFQAKALSADREKVSSFAATWLESGDESGLAALDGVERALVAMSGFPRMLAKHQRRGLPFEISQATALDLERWITDKSSPPPTFGLNNLRWMGNHLRRGLLEIGRLQFIALPCGVAYRIYVRRCDQETVVLAEAGLTASPEGWLASGAIGFTTSFHDDGKRIGGHRVDAASGRISTELSWWEAEDLELRFDRDSLVLHVHIPAGAGLSPAACDDSFQRAAEIFDRLFPEVNWKAFCCTAWLMDRELGHCLPADSNILAFGNRFYPLATPGATSRPLIERVLDSTPDWRNFQPVSSLQKAVIRHLREGGTFRLTSGFILRQTQTA